MKIGTVDLGERPVVLAPMEDVTDASFRLICKEQGADMTYSEFVSADALVRNIAATTRKLHIAEGERPTAIQIYGREVGPMVEAARIVAEARPDILDINFGCPVKKVAGKGAGAGMLRDIPKMLEITRAVVHAVDIPVTVKTRLGWDSRRTATGLRHTGAYRARAYPLADVYRQRRLGRDSPDKRKSALHSAPHRQRRHMHASGRCRCFRALWR